MDRNLLNIFGIILGIGFMVGGIRSTRNKKFTSIILYSYRTIRGPLAVFLGVTVFILGLLLLIPSILGIFHL